MYKLFYNPLVPITCLKQVMSFRDKIDFCNNVAIPEYCKSGDTTQNVDILANLVRLNWMVENLKYQPMVKPIVAVSDEKGNWNTVVGDTRLNAAEILNFTHVRVILQSKAVPYKLEVESGWLELTSLSQVGLIAGAEDSKVYTDPEDWRNNEIYWMEFETSVTSNHMHDSQQRARMIHNYINIHPDFVVSKQWFQSPIDWSLYDH